VERSKCRWNFGLKQVSGKHIRFEQCVEREESFDERLLIPQLKNALEKGEVSTLKLGIGNVDRTIGTALSSAVVRRFGAEGLPKDCIRLQLTGCAGQSFGAFLAPGISLELTGEANDFVGKGLSGGEIIIKTPPAATFEASQNVIAGNVVGYGATSGTIYLNGQAGERFAIRNSGMTMVLEGGGDHGCEYMTGGRVVVLGPVGVNFAAGMSGGIAYVYDESGDFDLKCNLDTVDLETVLANSADEAELIALLQQHICATNSKKAHFILSSWQDARSRFVKVFPVEYKQLLAKTAKIED